MSSKIIKPKFEVGDIIKGVNLYKIIEIYESKPFIYYYKLKAIDINETSIHSVESADLYFRLTNKTYQILYGD